MPPAIVDLCQKGLLDCARSYYNCARLSGHRSASGASEINNRAAPLSRLEIARSEARCRPDASSGYADNIDPNLVGYNEVREFTLTGDTLVLRGVMKSGVKVGGEIPTVEAGQQHITVVGELVTW
jgi:hypothetical protein